MTSRSSPLTKSISPIRVFYSYPRGFAPRPPLHALSRAASPARSVRVARFALLARTAAAGPAIYETTSTSPIVVPFRGPLRGQVLAHVERARHGVAGDGSREPAA